MCRNDLCKQVFCLIVHLVCLCSVMLLNGFVFIIATFYYMYSYTDEVFVTLKLDGENPFGVLSAVEKAVVRH